MTNSIPSTDFVLPILVSNRSQRQSYIFDLIFKQLLGIDYQIIEEVIEGKYLNYTNIESDFSFFAHDYLLDNSVSQPFFEEGIYLEKHFPFYSGNQFTLPFDPFSTCFYFVSRHEELNSKELDEHNRYKSEASFLIKNGWQFIPIVNYISDLLKIEIEKYFQITIQQTYPYTVYPTLDIDNGYAFYGRSIKYSFLKSIAKFDFKDLKIKYKASKDSVIDPFNTHLEIIQLLKDFNNKTVFFLTEKGEMNSNICFDKINSIVNLYKGNGFEIGIHPSYDSSSIQSETQKLEALIKQKVTQSRHHFIKTHPHSDYVSLSKMGIKEDFSMGYAKVNGFRAGICIPYKWFDIQLNKEINLLVQPFYFMDATFIFHTSKDLKQALEEINNITQQVKSYKGQMSFVFHNESLSDYGVYKNWKNFLKETIDLIA